jgi:streptogramin lyase
MMQQRLFPRLALYFCMSSVSTLLTGCTLQNTASANLVPATAIAGTVHGGQQAISGAKVYLLAVNTTGSGGQGITPSSTNASLSLLNSSVPGAVTDSIGYYVTSGSTGTFSISGDYSCTSGYVQGSTTKITLPGTEQVYLYVLGGTPVIDGKTPNTSIGLLAALGPCNNPTTKISVNEITTVGTAYAFAGYASDATHISTSGTALATTGINNAFATVANLVNIATGLPATATAGGNGTVPVATIYTLADILAACVNSNGGSSSPCATIFPYMQSGSQVAGGGNTPTDTATAIINLAHFPWPTQAGMDALYATVPSTGAPFTGALSAEPSDYTLTISYTGGSLNQAQAIAVDKAGDVWIANKGGNSVSEVSPTGSYLLSGFAGANLSAPTSLAIDPSGNVWVGSSTGINKIVPGTTPVAANFTPTNGTNITGLAVDSFSNILYVSAAAVPGTLGSINSSGTLVTSTSPTQLSGAPTSVAVDAAKTVWVGGTGSEYLAKFTETASALTYKSQATNVQNATSIAMDPSSTLFMTEQAQNFYTYQYNPTDTTVQTFFDGTSIQYPSAIAMDSAGNEWIASHGVSNTNTYINEFSNFDFDLSPTGSGFKGNGSFAGPYALAVDGSGNVWSVNYSTNTLVEMVGSAAPVATPIVANIITPYTHPASQP